MSVENNLAAKPQIPVKYYFEDAITNRKQIFKEALKLAQNGKVLYILKEEFNELPQLSQDLVSVNRHYMKMISFLYVKDLASLIESISTLPEWQHIPCTIILDNLCDYCPKENIQNACGVVALLMETVRTCSKILNLPCKLLISVSKESVGEDYCTFLNEMYPVL